MESKAFISLIGIENANVHVIADKENYKRVRGEIEKDSDVVKINNYATECMTVIKGEKEENVFANISNDFSRLDFNKIIKGNTPRYENEVALTNLMAKSLDVQIGDTVTIKYGGQQKEFIVVGLSQQISNLGMGIQMTDQAVKRIQQSYELTNFYVYLSEGSKTSEFMDRMNAKYANTSLVFYNNEELLSTSLLSFQTATRMLCIIFLVVSVFVIILTLLLLIRLKLVKERQSFGIFKSIGFTTKQLIVQVLFGFLPTIAVGVILGLAAGVLLSNPLIGVMLKGVGIAKMNFSITAWYAISIPLVIAITAIATIMISSLRIRKITPNELFHE